MTFDEARDVMVGIVKTVVDANLPFTMLYPNVTGQPPATGKWGRTVVKHAVGRQGSLAGADGRKVWDRIGTLWISLYTPPGDGNVAGYAIGQSMVSALEDSETIWMRNVTLEEMGSDGGFERFDVKAEFEYTHVR